VKSAFKTSGWGWLFGTGLEIWASNRFAFYTEVGFMKLAGKSSGDEGTMLDHASFLVVGGRLHFGGK